VITPRWAAESRVPRPGEPGFSSLPGERQLAERLGGRARPGSGNRPTLPRDVATAELLIESRETSAVGHRVRRAELVDLARRARAEGRVPAYLLTFWDEVAGRDEPWVMIPLRDWEARSQHL
jgi:hypothetical protein